MTRRTVQVLVVNDDDLECKCKRDAELTLESINITKVGFVAADLDKYDLVVYSGRLGKKIIKGDL